MNANYNAVITTTILVRTHLLQRAAVGPFLMSSVLRRTPAVLYLLLLRLKIMMAFGASVSVFSLGVSSSL